MGDVKIETTEGRTYLTSPYNPAVPAKAKAIGGRWDGGRKAWHFDARDEDRVAALAREIYGTDGRAPEGDLVTVRVKLVDHEGSKWDNHVEFAGRRIAERPGRDMPVRFAANVVLVEGTLPSSGGSMRYPNIDAGDDAIVEIRDLPRSALSVESENSYEIVDQAVDVDALLAERERLLARVAEIDALLPEPEGTEITTREAAAALGVSVRTVQRWAAAGKVQAHKDDAGRWVITITI
ncbi:helix-turn-helix domain-containing protein [Actinoallomurus purpureus]|uniref:helix-turn-helix domain-containing protein n=1 Tax=Actinoallomurus purpureus TaxID=478114 RepID=UPI002091F725|nr:helix-turn-helix domain-containing protein [Actinoallomurus purpureus]MCO6011560.1 helix-turn-helix domain-containing protein [Actinoallomurus purpureus]